MESRTEEASGRLHVSWDQCSLSPHDEHVQTWQSTGPVDEVLGSSSGWTGRGSAALMVQNGCRVSSLCSGQHASNWVQCNWVHLLKRCTQVWLSCTCTSFHCYFILNLQDSLQANIVLFTPLHLFGWL